MTRASCGNTTIDNAITELVKVIEAEQAAGRSPLRCLALIGTRFDPGTYVAMHGCDCPACRTEIAIVGQHLANGLGPKGNAAQPSAKVH